MSYPEYARDLLVDDAVVLHDDAPPLRAARRDRRPQQREDVEAGRHHLEMKGDLVKPWRQGCQMAKFDPFLSLDSARVEGVGARSMERKGSNFAA